MNLAWRIALYLVLAAVAVFASQRFFAGFSREMDRAAQRFETSELTRSDPAEPAVDGAPIATNDPTAVPAAAGSTNGTTAINPPAGAPRTPAPPGVAAPRKGWYGAIAFVSVLVLGVMVGRDVAGYLGHRVQREIYGEASEPVGDPEYDQAEEVWANGDHLEAIRLLREFLSNKPSKLHAAFRIAEIYEKDLHNNLAAALEYETILAHRFDPDRWGWAAIHLVNLYNRLDHTAKADALLQRIVAEHPGTDAAAKARERLGWPVGGAAEAGGEDDGPPPPDDGTFHLPRGFKPKKG